MAFAEAVCHSGNTWEYENHPRIAIFYAYNHVNVRHHKPKFNPEVIAAVKKQLDETNAELADLKSKEAILEKKINEMLTRLADMESSGGSYASTSSAASSYSATAPSGSAADSSRSFGETAAAGAGVALDFPMHLLDERAYRVDDAQPPPGGFPLPLARHPVSAEDHHRSGRGTRGEDGRHCTGQGQHRSHPAVRTSRCFEGRGRQLSRQECWLQR